MNYLFKLTILLISLSLYPQVEIVTKKKSTLKFSNLFSSESSNEVSCYRIPSIITAPNGDILAAIDERVPNCGDLRSNDNINIVMRRSEDNGATWSKIETIIDYPIGQSASDASMIVDRNTGAIFLFYNYMDLINKKDKYYFKVIKSLDNGLSWTKPLDITSQITKLDWGNDFKFITSGRGHQTKSGKLIHTIVNLEKGLFLFASDDHGNSWYVIDTAIKPADESKIIELEDGSWMINSRVNNVSHRYVHTSKDNGTTWQSKPEKSLNDPGCNASFIRYTSIKNGDDKNRLLLSNTNNKNARRNLTIRISYDEGKTWSTGKTVYSGEAAYSSMCILENGNIGLFFEKDDYKENVFVRLTLDWLTDGKDKIINN